MTKESTMSFQSGAAPVVGAWRLVSFEIRNEDGTSTHPYGVDAKGSIIYTNDGYFSAQVHKPKRSHIAAGDQMKGTSEENTGSFRSFISYYGSYRWNDAESFVVHEVEGSLFANWEGTQQKRIAKLNGGRLELTTPPTQWGGGGAIVGVLVWERATR